MIKLSQVCFVQPSAYNSVKAALNSELYVHGIRKMTKGSTDYHETSLEFQVS
jgi:hypothetical protein